MQITSKQLKRIIKEELDNQVTEVAKLGPDPDEGSIDPQTRAKIEAQPFSGEIPVFAKKDGAVVQTGEKIQWSLKLEEPRYWRRRSGPLLIVPGTWTFKRGDKVDVVELDRQEPFEISQKLEDLNSEDPKIAFKRMAQSTFIWRGPSTDAPAPEEKKTKKPASEDEMNRQIAAYMARHGGDSYGQKWSSPASNQGSDIKKRPRRYQENNMKITKEQLKQIIKEELEVVLNEGPLAYVKQQLGTAGRHNRWLKSFGRLQYLSGPEDSLTNWISQARNAIGADTSKPKDPQAKEALNKVRQLMRQYKQSEMTEEQSVNKKIDAAQSEAQKIADKLSSELENVSKKSGLDVETLSTLVKQFMDQEL